MVGLKAKNVVRKNEVSLSDTLWFNHCGLFWSWRLNIYKDWKYKEAGFCKVKSQYIFAVLNDVFAPVGSKAELVCNVDGLKGPLRDCLWVSPDKKEFRSGKKSYTDEAISVRIDSRRDECVMVNNGLFY